MCQASLNGLKKQIKELKVMQKNIKITPNIEGQNVYYNNNSNINNNQFMPDVLSDILKLLNCFCINQTLNIFYFQYHSLQYSFHIQVHVEK